MSCYSADLVMRQYTGLKLELLQEYCLVALDVFRGFQCTKDRSEQTAAERKKVEEQKFLLDKKDAQIESLKRQLIKATMPFDFVL